jgi:hypothetical protein
MKLWIVLPMLLLVLSGCAKTAYRNSCKEPVGLRLA